MPRRRSDRAPRRRSVLQFLGGGGGEARQRRRRDRRAAEVDRDGATARRRRRRSIRSGYRSSGIRCCCRRRRSARSLRSLLGHAARPASPPGCAGPDVETVTFACILGGLGICSHVLSAARRRSLRRRSRGEPKAKSSRPIASFASRRCQLACEGGSRTTDFHQLDGIDRRPLVMRLLPLSSRCSCRSLNMACLTRVPILQCCTAAATRR